MIAELYMYPDRIHRQTLASRRGIMDPYKTAAWCKSQADWTVMTCIQNQGMSSPFGSVKSGDPLP